jgi:hypothetical protein
MMMNYWYLLFFGLYPSSLCFFFSEPLRFEGWLYLWTQIEVTSIERIQQCRFQLGTGEEPSLET